MTRLGLIRASILLDVSDDYESFPHVLNAVCIRSAPDAPPFERAEVIAILTELMQAGFVEAYCLSPREPIAALGKISDWGEIEKASTYFYITAEGIQDLARMRTAEDWPFDDFLGFLPGFKLEDVPTPPSPPEETRDSTLKH